MYPGQHMSIEDNIFYAKRNIVDSIWKEANIEGIDITFPATKAVFEGAKIANLTQDQTTIINNLKHGWQFIFDLLMRLSICHMYGRYINSLATILFPILDNCDILMCILAEQAGNRKYQTSTLQKPLSRKLRIWNLGENARLRCSVIFVAPNFLVMEISEQRNS